MGQKEDDYALGIGSVISNLQTLEVLLRVYLYHHEVSAGGPKMANPYGLPVGTEVEKNGLTDFRSLGQLIRAYNDIVRNVDSSLVIDDTLVEVRDALAHGRLVTPTPSGPVRLLRFSDPKKSKIKITMNLAVDKAWLEHQRDRIFTEMQKLIKALGATVTTA